MRKGFAPIILVTIVLAVTTIAAFAYYQFKYNSNKQLRTTQTNATASISNSQKIDLKFKNGSTVRLRDGKFVSTSGEDLSDLQAILNSVPGIKIEKLFSQPDQNITDKRNSLVGKTDKDLPDLNLWYLLILPKEANAQSIVAKLKSIPIVETAYIAPTPVPLPAQTDETADWKTLSANTAEDTLNGAKPATVRYSYKHPAGWVTYSGEYSYNIAVSSNKDYVIGYPTKLGEINLFANNYLNNTDLPPKGKVKTALGGKPATKDVTNFSDTNEIIKNVTYIAESIPTQEGNIIAGFRLSCVYYGSTDNIDLEKTCDLIASTFKFLD